MSLAKSDIHKRTKKSTKMVDPLQREWQRIQRLQKQNAKLRQELQEFEQECIAAIREDEEKLARTVLQQATHLSGFLTRRSMPQWQHVELRRWIGENLNEVASSPFCDREALNQAMQQIQAIEAKLLTQNSDKEVTGDADINQSSTEKPGATRQNDKNKQTSFDQAFSPMEDMFEELFPEFEQDENEIDEAFLDDDLEGNVYDDDGAFWDELFDEYQQREEAANHARRERNKSLQEMLKKTSINAMFRRLARLLHPDREQDPDLKALRHDQMTQLIQARDNNDVFTLLNMYQQNTGESPLADLAGDRQEILPLFKAQAEQLRDQRDQIIRENPLRGHFYNRFYGKTPQSRKRKLQHYCEELQLMNKHEHRVTQSIRNIATLKPYLVERYDSRVPFGFIADLMDDMPL